MFVYRIIADKSPDVALNQMSLTKEVMHMAFISPQPALRTSACLSIASHGTHNCIEELIESLPVGNPYIDDIAEELGEREDDEEDVPKPEKPKRGGRKKRKAESDGEGNEEPAKSVTKVKATKRRGKKPKTTEFVGSDQENNGAATSTAAEATSGIYFIKSKVI